MKRVLLTGAAGFAGSHICQHIIEKTGWKIVALDRLTYAGKLDRLKDIPRERIEFVCHDFRAPFPNGVLRKIGTLNYIIHNGAETHVLRSITDPETFMCSNVIGTFHVLEMAKKVGCEKFLYTSTDEVFGPAPEGISYKENDPPKPTNPYSATKAAGEMFCHAYAKTYAVPTLITRCMNLFGEKQHPEKFVPLVISKLVKGETVPVHSKNGKIGSRNWIHARNYADAILFLLEKGAVGETYHVAGMEYTNEEMARMIAEFSRIQEFRMELVDAETHRPGHDLRYALDDSKIRALGWDELMWSGDSLANTVRWFLNNKEWLDD